MQDMVTLTAMLCRFSAKMAHVGKEGDELSLHR